jgi:hypothetical protein
MFSMFFAIIFEIPTLSKINLLRPRTAALQLQHAFKRSFQFASEGGCIEKR